MHAQGMTAATDATGGCGGDAGFDLMGLPAELCRKVLDAAGDYDQGGRGRLRLACRAARGLADEACEYLDLASPPNAEALRAMLRRCGARDINVNDALGLPLADIVSWLRAPGTLSSLRFRCGSIGPCGLAPLAACPGLSQLEVLDAELGAGADADAGVDLSALSLLVRLSELQVPGIPGIPGIRGVSALAPLVRLRHLDLSNASRLESIAPLASLTGLLHLDLGGCAALTSLAPISGCLALRHLDVARCPLVTTLEPLSALASLRLLGAGGSGRGDLRPLAALAGSLTYLDLESATGVRLSHLTVLTSLQVLRMRSCFNSHAPWAGGGAGQEEDGDGDDDGDDEDEDAEDPDWFDGAGEEMQQSNPFAPLATMVRLKHLDLGCCYWLLDLGPLSSLSELRLLDLRSCPSLSDLRPLEALAPTLEVLTLSQCYSATDLRPLAALRALRVLDMTSVPWLADLRPLSELASLSLLKLDGCGVSDLAPLSGLSGLRLLSVGSCHHVSDLRPLSGLVSLTSLDITHTGPSGAHGVDLGQLSHLAACTQLGRLYMTAVPPGGAGGASKTSPADPGQKLYQNPRGAPDLLGFGRCAVILRP